ncbi:ParA family protein [Streptomyces europaeiscabiei]|uniref:ParA family protein n=1 Tax=Streptomyces europaeiscabiei TaxID=146819 RepID=UPI0038F728B3
MLRALAETGKRVVLADFDPQCHLTRQLGHELIGIDDPSLAKLMLGESKAEARDLLVSIEGGDIEDRLRLLPGCKDAFLLDARRHVRIRETALEKVLEPLEKDEDIDFVVVDCPPSLGSPRRCRVRPGAAFDPITYAAFASARSCSCPARFTPRWSRCGGRWRTVRDRWWSSTGSTSSPRRIRHTRCGGGCGSPPDSGTQMPAT